MDTEVSETPVVSFRPVKRQKFLRKRVEESDDVPTPESAVTDTEQHRRRDRAIIQSCKMLATKARCQISCDRESLSARRGGIEFSTSSSQAADKNKNMALTIEDTEADILKARLDRFTAHTGQKVDVDKHMYVVLHSLQ